MPVRGIVIALGILGLLLVIVADLGMLRWLRKEPRSALRDIGVALLTGALLGYFFVRIDDENADREARRANVELAHSIGFGEPLPDVNNGRPNPILRGLDLSEANLSGLILENLDLTDTDLSGAVMIGTRLNGSTLDGTDLRGANLMNARLEDALMVQTKLDGQTTMSGVSFDNSTLNSVDFSRVERLAPAGGNSWGGISCVGDVRFPEDWLQSRCP